mmetsp:Transcript_14471/g.23741  ORF Transcript_14471/g.23741 Transcript_14471/m.23741 type:complete len:128 (-) Transcript_14471:21-404(-)
MKIWKISTVRSLRFILLQRVQPIVDMVCAKINNFLKEAMALLRPSATPAASVSARASSVLKWMRVKTWRFSIDGCKKTQRGCLRRRESNCFSPQSDCVGVHRFCSVLISTQSNWMLCHVVQRFLAIV